MQCTRKPYYIYNTHISLSMFNPRKRKASAVFTSTTPASMI